MPARSYSLWRISTDLIVASLLLGILNAFVRPILMLLALPLLIFTLGLFTLVINALLLYFVGCAAWGRTFKWTVSGLPFSARSSSALCQSR